MGFTKQLNAIALFPWGRVSLQNMLAGKSFHDQVRALFQYRVDMLKIVNGTRPKKKETLGREAEAMTRCVGWQRPWAIS